MYKMMSNGLLWKINDVSNIWTKNTLFVIEIKIFKIKIIEDDEKWKMVQAIGINELVLVNTYCR